MKNEAFLNAWIGLCLVISSCQNLSYKNTTTMPSSLTKPVAQWSTATNQQPIDFIYQDDGVCLVTFSNSYLELKPESAISAYPLENIKELVQLQPWKEQFILLEFNEKDYANVAYQIQNLNSSKQVLDALEDPQKIAYNAIKDIFYYKHSSIRLYTYHPIDKKSTPLFPDREVSDFCISDNSQYLALENSTEVTVINTRDHSIVYNHAIPAGTFYSLVGVTDSGDIITMHHSLARKNEGQSAEPTVVLLQKNGSSPLTTSSEGWAKWHRGHLMVWDQETFRLYNQTILE